MEIGQRKVKNKKQIHFRCVKLQLNLEFVCLNILSIVLYAHNLVIGNISTEFR